MKFNHDPLDCSKIDPYIVDIIEYLNNREGIRTHYCCAGVGLNEDGERHSLDDVGYVFLTGLNKNTIQGLVSAFVRSGFAYVINECNDAPNETEKDAHGFYLLLDESTSESIANWNKLRVRFGLSMKEPWA